MRSISSDSSVLLVTNCKVPPAPPSPSSGSRSFATARSKPWTWISYERKPQLFHPTIFIHFSSRSPFVVSPLVTSASSFAQSLQMKILRANCKAYTIARLCTIRRFIQKRCNSFEARIESNWLSSLLPGVIYSDILNDTLIFSRDFAISWKVLRGSLVSVLR